MRKIVLILYLLFSVTATAETEFVIDLNKEGDALPSALLKVAEEAFQLNSKGLDALSVNNFDEALNYFEQASLKLPNYTDAINNCGVVYFRRGNISMAEETWQKVIQIDAQYATAYYNLGIISFNTKKKEAAKAYFLQALNVHKRFVDALVMLGKVNFLLDNDKEAMRTLKKAHNINPKHKRAWQTLAYGYIQIGDTLSAQTIARTYKTSAFALRMLGEIEATRGHTDKAIDYLIQALSQGGDKAILLMIAQLQLDTGKQSEAQNTLQRYFDSVSFPSADAWLLAGIIAKKRKNIAETKRYFEQGLKYYPKDQTLRFNLGQVYFYQKEYGMANKTWTSLADTLNDPSLFHLRAIAAHKQKNLPLAKTYILQAITLDSKAEYYDLLGVLFYEKGEKEKAITNFKRALSLNPSLHSAKLNLALTEKGKKSIAPAIIATKKQLKSCKSDCNDFSLQLSVLYYHDRQYAKAVETLNAVTSTKRDLRIYKHLALYYKALTEWDNAIRTLELADKRFGTNREIEYELAETYLQAGSYNKAIAMLKNLLPSWERDTWRLYYQLGYAYVKQNNFEEAVGALQNSLQKKKDNIAASGLLAFVYNKQGKTRKARSLWEKNLKDDPKNPVVWINMGLMLEKEGKYKKAVEKYKKALSLSDKNTSININIGNAYELMGEDIKALAFYEKALDSDKRLIAAYNAFNVTMKLEKIQKSEKMLSLLKKEYPKSVHTKRASGEMLLNKGDTTSALLLFELLPEKNENDWFVLANAYLSLGRNVEAKKALGHIPTTTEWRKAKATTDARIAFKSGKYSEAYTLMEQHGDTSFNTQYNTALAAFNAQEYNKVISLGKKLLKRATGSDKSDVYRLLGNASVKAENWEDAEFWFSKLVHITPNDGVVLYNMAVASYNLDRVDDSWAWYLKARKIDQSISNTDIENRYKAKHAKPITKIELATLDKWYNEAVDFQQKGKYKEAKKIYRRIIQRSPHHYQAWNNLGTIFSARGKFDKAIECHKSAIAANEEVVDGYANLVIIYIAMEQIDQAEEWLNKGKVHAPDNEILKQVELQLDNARN